MICQYYKPEPFRISDICEELVHRGHEVHVVTGYPIKDEYDLAQKISLLATDRELYKRLSARHRLGAWLTFSGAPGGARFVCAPWARSRR